MLIVDVPVQSQEEAFALERQILDDEARVAVVLVAQNIGNLVDRGDVDWVLGRVGESRVDRTGVLNVLVIHFFVSQGEEQLVLDDRAADIEAEVLVFERIRNDRAAFDLVTGHAVVVVKIKDRSVELVRSGLRNDVDGTARELAVLHVKRCKLDCRRSDRVVGDRKRLPTTRARACVQTESVARDRAIDRDRVVTRRAAQTLDARTIATAGTGDTDARVHSHDVANLPCNAGHLLNVFERER